MSRAALFDLDGTLVHLPVAIEERRAEVAAIFEARGWRGAMRPILAAIDAAASEVAASLAERATLITEARSVLDGAEIAAASKAELLPGAAELLTAAVAAGAAVGVVTNNCSDSARRVLARFGLAELVGAVVGRDDVARPKPDPAGLGLALDRLDSPTGVVWVGDSAGDVEAGLALRSLRPGLELRIVGVAASVERADQLVSLGADVVVGELAEIDLAG